MATVGKIVLIQGTCCRLISPRSSICLSIEFQISNFERIDSARKSTAKFRLALALEFQLRKFCGAESECATEPLERPDGHELAGENRPLCIRIHLEMSC